MGESLNTILARLDCGDCPDSKWPDRKGEYWPLCPFHPDQRSGSFSVSERGYKCFACGENGSLRKLAGHLGVDLPQQPTHGLTLQEYADAKRLPIGFLKSLGLSETQEQRNGRSQSVVLMPYKDGAGHTVSVRRRLFLRKGRRGKDNRFRWRKGDKPMLYGLWRLAEMRKHGWVLLVEGESDCHTAWLHDAPALGVPGADTWRCEWASHLVGLDVYVWKEPDVGGDTFIEKVREGLPEARVIIPPEGNKDLSDGHVKSQDVVALVEQLKAEATPIGEVKSQVQKARNLHDLAPWVRSQLGKRASRETKLRVANAIAGWLLEHKRLLVDTGQDGAKGGRPYLLADDGALWPLERHAVSTRLTLYEAGLNGTETTYSFVLEALTMEAYKRGQAVRLSRWQEAQRGGGISGCRLYVSCGPTYLVRARGDTLEKLSNGTDGVWFAGDLTYPEWEPTEPVDPLTLAAFNPCLETPPEVPEYTAKTQKDLVAAWLAALLSGLRPLPLLAAIGQKGGGKTTLAKAVLRVLLGTEASPTLLSDDKRDFWALVTTMPVVGLDNLDSDVPSWLPDAMAATVTGVNVDQRELYTDGNRLSRPVTAALVVTTRTASFARADVAERTLPVLTGEFEDAERVADDGLLAEVDAHRDGILSWCTLTAWKLLAGRHKAPEGLPLRFVDYARMVWAYMRTQGRQEMAAQALLALRQAQSLTVGEADPLIEALVMHYDALSTDGAWHGSASELVRALTEAGADLPYLGGGKSIARQLREAKGTLALMGIRLSERSFGSNTQFSLWRRSSGETGENGESYVSSSQRNAHGDNGSRRVLPDSPHSPHTPLDGDDMPF